MIEDGNHEIWKSLNSSWQKEVYSYRVTEDDDVLAQRVC